ncbi:hypothetical protein HDU97_002938 [Phlyctochytrium planicorne]|nr:hypothetical protein HDU97_002938 [Phlyctochytrium planicorne]
MTRLFSTLLLRPVLSIQQLITRPAIHRHQDTALTSRTALMDIAGTRSYKSKSSLKLRCEHCFFAKRRGKLRVICKENPKHKQVQI